MMAYLRIAFAAIVAIVLVTVALANRAMIEVKLLPDTLAALLGFNLDFRLPLFILLGLAVVVGLLLGFIWEWFREMSYRAEAKKLARQNDAMRTELDRARKVAPSMHKDDVRALVETG
jgi:putative membrane protein